MLEFEDDPDYDYLLNLFKTALVNCDEDEPDFNWNKDLKMEKAEFYQYVKYFFKGGRVKYNQLR